MYDIQIIPVKKDDVLLLHVSKYMDLDDCQNILREVKRVYPNNDVLIANENILEKITILRKDDSSSTFDLKTLYPDIFKEIDFLDGL